MSKEFKQAALDVMHENCEVKPPTRALWVAVLRKPKF